MFSPIVLYIDNSYDSSSSSESIPLDMGESEMWHIVQVALLNLSSSTFSKQANGSF